MRLVRAAAVQNRPQDVNAAASESDHGLVVAFSFLTLALIEQPAVGGLKRAERGLVKDAFECAITSGCATLEAHLARLSQYGG
jgi:hypothetical protein